MSKMLFIFERDMPTVSIIREMFSGLRDYPEIETSFMYLMDVMPRDIDANDLIILIRPNNNYSWKIAKQARLSGHLVITYCDDDLLNLPRDNASISWRKAGLKKALSESDVIWSSSPYILKKYQGYTVQNRTAHFDTVIGADEINGIDLKRTGSTTKIVYAAAPSHAELFEKFVNPITPRLFKQYGDQISFTFVSVHPEFSGGKCTYVPGMPLKDYRDYMKRERFDIGLAPLYDDEFSKCKYFNKYLEYTMHGIVGIYSNTEPYTFVIKNKENGFLTENTAESWYDALSFAINEVQVRRNCLNNAIRYLKDKHSEQACLEKIIKDIPEILMVKSKYLNCKNFQNVKIMYIATRPLETIYLAFFYFHRFGIRALIKRISRHFVEAKAYKRRK